MPIFVDRRRDSSILPPLAVNLYKKKNMFGVYGLMGIVALLLLAYLVVALLKPELFP